MPTLGRSLLAFLCSDLVQTQEFVLEAGSPGVSSVFGLTSRELVVLGLVARGLTNRQIADSLYISANTAGVHVSNILRKLEVSSRTEAATFAQRHGLLDAEDASIASV